ncbi:MAG: DNRLRE domain-containing protein [Phycisphaerae bacterium]|nr:DNRLRE domain-containing protein [Phycisphaerae bacterium]
MKNIISMFVLSMVLSGSFVNAANYYVSRSGDDTKNGTSSKPWRTIQHAIDSVSSGDTVYIRGGKYHEAVTKSSLKGTSSNPITFTNYNDEEVIIAGTMQIDDAGWSLYSGNIYRKVLTEDIWQLFVDDDMMTVARWPNVGQDWHVPDTSSGFDPTPGSYWDMDSTQGRLADNSTWGHFYNDERYESLVDLNISVEGAMLVGYRCLVSGNDVFTEQITSHVAGSDNFTHTTVNFPVGSTVSQAASGARYYIEADLGLLDAPGEWFYDKDTKELYVWFKDSGSPAGKDIEGKNKNFILDLTSCEYLNFTNIKLFAGAFDLSDTYDTAFDNCKFIYPSYGRRMLKVITPGPGYVIHDGAAPYNRTVGSRDPANLTWIDCEFANYEGVGLYIRTNGGNLVENCYFHNGQILQVVYGAVSDHKGSGTILRRNTFHTLGLNNATKNGPDGILEYNHIYNMHFDGDFSACQTNQSFQERTEHRYSWIHDCKGRNGVRFDGDAAGIRGKVHHIVSMHNMRGFRLKGDQHQIYNLTALNNTPKSDINIAFEKFYGYDPPECMEYECRILGRRGSDPYRGNENSIVRNIAGNVIDDWPLVAPDNIAVWHGNDIGKDVEDQLRDAVNLDFRPKAGSELIDAGVVVPGFTDIYNGSAPDIGAYEYGDTDYWIPGCKFDKASTPIPPDNTSGVKTDADLMWLEGKDAVEHKVYFGTESGNLPLVSTQTNNIYNPGTLDENTEYFWRVDTETANGTITGDEWSFTLVIPEPETEIALFYAIGDTYVDSNYPSTNFGASTEVELRTPDTGLTTRHGFMKFNPQVVGEIVAATLRLYSLNVLSGGAEIFTVADNSWDEMQMVWNPLSANAPPAMSALPIGSLAPSYGWDDEDVTSWYTENGVKSIGLVRGPKDSNRRVQSRESAYPPELVIEYIPTGPVNHAPYFQSTSFASANAYSLVEYSADISSEARDPDGDVITFSKSAGPGWLIVNADGTLAGTPQLSNVGVSYFTMRVMDSSGAYDEGSMTIEVLAGPDIGGDGSINLLDFVVLSQNWEKPCVEPDWCNGADVNRSGVVSLNDLRLLSESWLD